MKEDKKVEEIKKRIMDHLKRFPVIMNAETGELAKCIFGDLMFAEYTVEKAIEMAIYETLEYRRVCDKQAKKYKDENVIVANSEPEGCGKEEQEADYIVTCGKDGLCDECNKSANSAPDIIDKDNSNLN